MSKKEWSIDNVIKDEDDGNIMLDLTQDLDDKNPITDDVVRTILTKNDLDLSKVTSIDLTGCSLITDEALKLIGEKCSRLEGLNIRHCVKNVTDEGIRAVLQTNPNIKELNFCHCEKVTVATLRAVIEYTPNITYLYAAAVGWFADEVGLSVLPDDIQFGTLTKLERFYLSSNEIKKLPKSMATLPHGCNISIFDNPLESPPNEMAEDGRMPPATIGRFYAEEMVKRPDFNLSVLDSHIKECGGTIGTNGYHSNCAIIMTVIRAQTGFSAELKEECEKRLDDDRERLAVVRERQRHAPKSDL